MKEATHTTRFHSADRFPLLPFGHSTFCDTAHFLGPGTRTVAMTRVDTSHVLTKLGKGPPTPLPTRPYHSANPQSFPKMALEIEPGGKGAKGGQQH